MSAWTQSGCVFERLKRINLLWSITASLAAQLGLCCRRSANKRELLLAAALHAAGVCGRTVLWVLTPWSCESRWVPARWHTAPPGGAWVPFLEAMTPAGRVPGWGCPPHRTGRCSGRRRKAALSPCGCCRCPNLWHPSGWHWCCPTARACSPPATDTQGKHVHADDLKV